MKQRTSTRSLLSPSSLKLFALVLGLIASACSSNLTEEGNGTTPIRFNNSVFTKASVTTSESLNKIGVYGYSHSINTPWADIASDADRIPNYFRNKAVIKNGTSWVYDGMVLYWPDQSRQLSFFAYAPFSDVDPNTMLSPSLTVPSGSPTVAFQTVIDVTKQVDLIWDSQPNKTVTSSVGGAITFNLHHALTSINFNFWLSDNDKGASYIVTVDKITMGELADQGVLHISDSVGSVNLWSDLVQKENLYTLTAANGCLQNTILDATKPASDAFTKDTPRTTTNGLLMLIPQALETGKTHLTLTYTLKNVITGKSEVIQKSFDLSQSTVPIFKQGAGVVYGVEISISNGAAIIVEVGDFLTNDKWIDPEKGEEGVTIL